ncbi:hypothetical protein [Streptomyces sp. NPDC001381]|uniref:hypothetical protein n=1 Tax=Streptomyces sp. NPDC001381 TaxID=3364567 RepID=UPI0036CD7FEA
MCAPGNRRDAFAGEERPWPMDLVPTILDAVEWELVQRGVAQRVRALEACLVLRARKAAEGLDPHETAVAGSSLVADRVSCLPGATGVNTPATETRERGAGVCQDIGHVTPHKGVYRGVAGGPPEVTAEFTRVA